MNADKDELAAGTVSTEELDRIDTERSEHIDNCDVCAEWECGGEGDDLCICPEEKRLHDKFEDALEAYEKAKGGPINS